MSRMHPYDRSIALGQREIGTSSNPNWAPGVFVGPQDPPPAIAARLSEHWGATSLHGMVFRKPRGVKFIHCGHCLLRVTPGARRVLLEGALRDTVSGPIAAVALKSACLEMQAWRRRHAT